MSANLQKVPTDVLRKELKIRDAAPKAVATVRMPLETLQKAHAKAQQENMSLNSWILQLIQNNL